MNTLLTTLGVPGELQAYFGMSGNFFDYGDELELFGPDFHIVPVTCGIWLAGNDGGTELIVTTSALEAIAYLTLNRWRYSDLSALTLISLGQLPHPRQLEWIRGSWQKRKITLVLGGDLNGRVADIVVAAGIAGRDARLRWADGVVQIACGTAAFEADPEKLTLNLFEKLTGIRTGIRTRKPVRHLNYLDQLRYANRS